MSDDISILYRWLDEHQDEMILALQGVLHIPSKKDKPVEGAPFGASIGEALDYSLELASKMGFDTKNVDGYAGHAEFGSGSEMIAALGHLDVVPEGEGWSYPPYGAEIHGEYLYARGSEDDKGPLYAALFAAKSLKESGLPLRRRVRVIFGCDEESGFGCMNHYWGPAGEERPLMAFTPDAVFPLVYAEKGIANLTLVRPIFASPVRTISGGMRPNMVPEKAQAMLDGNPGALYQAFIKLEKYWDKNVEVIPEETGLKIIARGKSAHGSTPEFGDNAVSRLLRVLLELKYEEDASWMESAIRLCDITGGALDIAGEDEVSGQLTANLGVFEMQEGLAKVVINIRYPVSWNFSEILNNARTAAEAMGWTLESYTDSPPLYVPLDEDPVKTLLKIYREETGDLQSKPETMGGGTYARATPNAVAYGAHFPGAQDGPAHEADERMSLPNFMKAAKIYARAFYELAR